MQSLATVMDDLEIVDHIIEIFLYNQMVVQLQYISVTVSTRTLLVLILLFFSFPNKTFPIQSSTHINDTKNTSQQHFYNDELPSPFSDISGICPFEPYRRPSLRPVAKHFSPITKKLVINSSPSCFLGVRAFSVFFFFASFRSTKLEFVFCYHSWKL